ncbi:hypothetical protein [Natrinema altunense]|uniref:Uncharacterized protein n=1 Tax=Natrinema altunense TaxID=222984 RepID=A0A482XUA8_9EURY|nr:hypothetical protein [Natrinema altunense]RZH66749.1 hypothetical protein ELS17_13265 [Natrinema altunense]
MAEGNFRKTRRSVLRMSGAGLAAATGLAVTGTASAQEYPDYVKLKPGCTFTLNSDGQDSENGMYFYSEPSYSDDPEFIGSIKGPAWDVEATFVNDEGNWISRVAGVQTDTIAYVDPTASAYFWVTC